MNFPTVVPDEGSRRDLNEVLTNILDDVAPEEVEMLSWVEGLSSNSATAAAGSGLGTARVRRRGFPGVLETGMVCIHLVAGTLALIDAYAKKRERQDQRELEYSIREEWQKALIQAGMSAELARQIPVKFSADMIRFITTQRFSQPDGRENQA